MINSYPKPRTQKDFDDAFLSFIIPGNKRAIFDATSYTAACNSENIQIDMAEETQRERKKENKSLLHTPYCPLPPLLPLFNNRPMAKFLSKTPEQNAFYFAALLQPSNPTAAAAVVIVAIITNITTTTTITTVSKHQKVDGQFISYPMLTIVIVTFPGVVITTVVG